MRKSSPLSRPWVRVAALAAISACSLALFVMTFMVLLPKVSMSYERVAGSMSMVRRRGAAFLELTTPVQGPRVSVAGKALIVPRQDQTGPGAVLGQRVGVVYARSLHIPSRNITLTWEDLVADETRWEKKYCNFPNGAFNPAAVHEGDVPPCVCAANTSWVGPSCGVCAEWASQPDQADPCNGRGSLTNPDNTDGDPDFDFCGAHAANTTCECTVNHWAGRWCTECPQPYRGAQVFFSLSPSPLTVDSSI